MCAIAVPNVADNYQLEELRDGGDRYQRGRLDPIAYSMLRPISDPQLVGELYMIMCVF